MKNTPTSPPISERSNDRLIEDLCLALRSVGVWEQALPSDPRAVSHVEEVQRLAGELKQRGIDFASRLQLLSEETGWFMPELLTECLGFPVEIPRVRFLDGQLKSEVAAAEQREKEQHAALKKVELQPFVEALQQVIIRNVSDALARADLLEALEMRAIRYLCEELPKHVCATLSKSESEAMERLMFEWG